MVICNNHAELAYQHDNAPLDQRVRTKQAHGPCYGDASVFGLFPFPYPQALRTASPHSLRHTRAQHFGTG
jgi:hypothetical protein